MGDSFSAIQDDVDELAYAMKNVGLDKDAKYSTIGPYSVDADTVIQASRENCSKEETIRRIIFKRHELQAKHDYDNEMKERKLLDELYKKYRGTVA